MKPKRPANMTLRRPLQGRLDVEKNGAGALPMLTTSSLADEFQTITGLRPDFRPDYRAAVDRLIAFLATRDQYTRAERRRRFLAHTNWKFRLNAEPLAAFYSVAAQAGFTFHYHHKCAIQRAFDMRDSGALDRVLCERGIPSAAHEQLRRVFCPVEEEVTVQHLRNECEEPSKLRREKGDRDIQADIVQSHFSAFIWSMAPTKDLHAFFDPTANASAYHESFWEQLQASEPTLFNRQHALHVLRLDGRIVGLADAPDTRRAQVCDWVRQAYESLNNHGFLAIIIERADSAGSSMWEIAADVTLYAEKHDEVLLKSSYFRWQRVSEVTAAHVKGIDLKAARFDLANEGFTYRDCFVLASVRGDVERLLLVFQKNQRDETPIPCPTCRSRDVQGNSYPSLGVRSWECNNLLCPERSKYNRGKRYAFRALMMQQGIDEPRNEIPVASVRRWSRDVVVDASDTEVMEMLVRHYSMYGDTVRVFNWPEFSSSAGGRRFVHADLGAGPPSAHSFEFWDGPLFARYVVAFDHPAPHAPKHIGACSGLDVFQGDAAEVLRAVQAETFDGAVTSPPYYNAREYAQWPNVYCYLRDMFLINREVFRVLKPGALYLYNVFDYFDNENTVVFSAMGKKRMILSSYTVDLFKRIGFRLLGTVVWDKGEIEGKRGFNAGNFSPFYQAPFNCWEHVLAFERPDPARIDARRVWPMLNRVMREKPVFKMVRGENVHGHSAPFPDAIPELLLRELPKGAIVLDPFAGSLTTGRVALRHGVRAVCIERSGEYCQLGLRMLAAEQGGQVAQTAQLSLL